MAIVAGAGPLGQVTTAALAARGVAVLAADRNEHALRELPEGVRTEVDDPTESAVAKSLMALAPQQLDTPAKPGHVPGMAIRKAA